MLAPTYPSNLDPLRQFRDELGSDAAQIAADRYLLNTLILYAPPHRVEQAIATARILAGPVSGRREPDGSTGRVDCIEDLPGEGK